MSRVGKLMMSWLCVSSSSFPRRRESLLKQVFAATEIPAYAGMTIKAGT